jgi:DNA mismatch endonuclease (patch repair protein)
MPKVIQRRELARAPTASTRRRGVPVASSPDALKRMQSARQRDTTPERELRSILHRQGFRYRVDCRVLPGLSRRADLVFKRAHLAVFVDGCFWHGCPTHGTWPKANNEWWRDKIINNQRRDADTDAQLRAAGWRVIRVWEHENAADAADRVCAMLAPETYALGRA